MDNIDEIIGTTGEETEANPSGKDPEPEKDNKELEDKKSKLSEEVSNLEKAKSQALKELQEIRDTKKKTKSSAIIDEEIPIIDLSDPAAKAWDKHISDKVSPVQMEIDKEKEEVRAFALQEFLRDKPNLSKNPDKLKELMDVYDKIHTASERTREGVIMDLDKAYAAVFHQQLFNAARRSRIEDIESDILTSDIAITRGATTYSSEKERGPKLSEDDKKILSKWGIEPEEWIDEKKKYS